MPLLRRPKRMHVDSFFHEETISLSVAQISQRKEVSVHDECPLQRWSATVSDVTHLNKAEHLKAPYIALIEKLRLQEIDTKTDRYEFLKVHPKCGDATDSCC